MLTNAGLRSGNLADISLFSVTVIFAAKASISRLLKTEPVKLWTLEDRLIKVVAIAKGIENRAARALRGF